MKLYEVLNNKLLLEMPQEDLEEAEMVLKYLFMKHMNLKFTFKRHINDRTVSPDAREKNVTKEEVIDILVKLIKRHKGKILGAKQRGQEYEATVFDKDRGINIMFAIDFGNKSKHNLFKVISIIKKKGFKPYSTDAARFYV